MYHGIGAGDSRERDEDEDRVPYLREHCGRAVPVNLEIIYSGQVVQPQRAEIVRHATGLVDIRREHEGELCRHERPPAEGSIVHVWSFGIVTRSMNGEQYTISKRSGNPRRVSAADRVGASRHNFHARKRPRVDRLDEDAIALRRTGYCLPRDGLGTAETASRSNGRATTMRMP